MNGMIGDLRRKQAAALAAMQREARRQRAAEARRLISDVDRTAVDYALQRVAHQESCSSDAVLLRKYIDSLEARLAVYEESAA